MCLGIKLKVKKGIYYIRHYASGHCDLDHWPTEPRINRVHLSPWLTKSYWADRDLMIQVIDLWPSEFNSDHKWVIVIHDTKNGLPRWNKFELNWWKGKPSWSIACTRKQQPRFYWSCSSVVMNDVTPLTPPSAWSGQDFANVGRTTRRTDRRTMCAIILYDRRSLRAY